MFFPNCLKEFDVKVNDTKYCLEHCPKKEYEIAIKRLCKYCDLEDDSQYICKECKNNKNKKEWQVIRYLRKNIDTNFKHDDSSEMLQGCSKRRPDAYFDLEKHVVIAEIDENQHKSYDDPCECSRINEIVNGIGGRPIIIIRYNPDKINNNNNTITIKQEDRLNCLVDTIKEELVKDYDKFIVKIIQLYYDDNFIEYEPIKIENITDLVSI